MASFSFFQHVSRCALGAYTPCQMVTLKSFKPDSASVGRSLRRRRSEALGGGHGVGLDLLAFDLAGGVGRVVAQQVDLAAEIGR